jgi:hypothetical protein
LFTGKPKEMCAGPNAVLIDDSDKNCELFEEEGGFSVLYPRSYNKLRNYRGNPIHYVIEHLYEFMGKVRAVA